MVRMIARSRTAGHRTNLDEILDALMHCIVGTIAGLMAVWFVTGLPEAGEYFYPWAVAFLSFPGGFLASEAIAIMVATRRKDMSLDEIEDAVLKYIDECSAEFHPPTDPELSIWVVKYLKPQWLEKFMAAGALGISRTPGYTWGDGVYVTPLAHAYSSAMYGRAGIVGVIQPTDVARVYDALDPRGLDLYQQWISTQLTLHRQLTTTIHADVANRELRNIFRTKFRIDLVFFQPDETPAGYSLPGDTWYCVSDWTAPAPGQSFASSARIRDCRFVAIVGEEFSQQQHRADWPRYFAPVAPATPLTWVEVAYATPLAPLYRHAHSANTPASPGASGPHPVRELVHVKPVQ
jgi:hypothetical protein